MLTVSSGDHHDGSGCRRQAARPLLFLVPTALHEWALSHAPQGAAAAKEAKGHPGPWKKTLPRKPAKGLVVDTISTNAARSCPTPGSLQR